MTETELAMAYLAWAEGSLAAIPEPVPIGETDVFEDDRTVINHLFFLIPEAVPGSRRCFFFLEENTFLKDAEGDLSLIRSEFRQFPQ